MTAEAKLERGLSFTNQQGQTVAVISAEEDPLSEDNMTAFCKLLQVPTDADMEWISVMVKKISYILAHKDVNVDAVCKKHGYVLLRERNNQLVYQKL